MDIDNASSSDLTNNDRTQFSSKVLRDNQGVKEEPRTQNAVTMLNTIASPYVLDHAPLTEQVRREDVHISLGRDVDEIFRRTGMQLAERIRDNHYDAIIYLDRAAREVRDLAEAAWVRGLRLNISDLPQAIFLNIGSEKTMQYRDGGLPLPTTKEEFQKQWGVDATGEDMAGELEEELKKYEIPDQGNVLIVDELRNSGMSAEFAALAVRLLRSDVAIESHWLIEEQNDRDILTKTYGGKMVVPWKHINEELSHSLIEDDINAGGKVRFVSKSRFPEQQNATEERNERKQEEEEYHRRLQYYFEGLYSENQYAHPIEGTLEPRRIHEVPLIGASKMQGDPIVIPSPQTGSSASGGDVW